MPVEIVCEQFSPVLPNNYKESSYPVGVFKYHLHNTSDVPVDCSVLFSFTNMVGWFNDFTTNRPNQKSGGNYNSVFHDKLPNGEKITGILFESTHTRDIPAEGNGQMSIACKGGEGIDISWHRTFNTFGDGSEIWEPFSKNGRLSNCDNTWICDPWRNIGGAIAANTTVLPGETKEITMNLTWDLPVIQFGNGQEYFRKYTKYFGVNGQNAIEIAKTSFSECDNWSKEIDLWHSNLIDNSKKPDWYNTMLFNELYMIIDGLTVWTDKAVTDGKAEDFFGLIECPDYDFYNTLDLWVYGSFVFIKYWPEIEKAVTGLYAKNTLENNTQLRKTWRGKDEYFPINVRGSLPHDHGMATEDPVNLVNGYANVDVSRWKDLNLQFVLLVYRDYVHSGDDDFLKQCYPSVKLAMEYMLQFDKDNDGMIENENFPDSTFDNLFMDGPSSFCGGLWLGSLGAIIKMSTLMKDKETASKFSIIQEKAKVVYDKLLWTGSYYRFDVNSELRDKVFIEQLFGIWYAGLCGIDDLIPKENIIKSLNSIYENNYLKADEGRYGAICIQESVIREGEENILAAKDTQITEILSGINISLACQLDHYGEKDKALNILKAIYNTIYVEKGLWFRTPAAWDKNGNFRAIMNMRPLIIWAMELFDE